MGVGNSKLEKALAESTDEERFYGLENFGNTCYANSVIQALYFCKPFRERMLLYAEQRKQRKGDTDDLPGCLADLFYQVVVGSGWHPTQGLFYSRHLHILGRT